MRMERARQQQVALVTCLAGMTEEEGVANDMPVNGDVLEGVTEMVVGKVC